VLSLPFASPSALVLQHAQLPESREILVVAHRHHVGLVEAIAGREGSRADGIAREHARVSLTNLEIVLSHRGLLDEVPGAALLTFAPTGEGESRA
jgi:GntR family transcriptional regulator of vanillate catabolism